MSALTVQPGSCRATRMLAVATLLVAAAAVVGALLAEAGPDRGWLWLHWFGKPAATALIWLLAWRARPAQSSRYRHWVLIGIACSLVGDVFLMLPGDLFVAGLLAFLVAHVCFIQAFLSDSRFAQLPLPWLGCLAFGAVNLMLLWNAIPTPLRIPVIAYVLVLAGMGGQALVRVRLFAQRRDPQTPAARLAALGALTFMLSDSVLAWNRFDGPVPLASLWVLSAYYLSLWWIARSVQRVDTTSEVATAA